MRGKIGDGNLISDGEQLFFLGGKQSAVLIIGVPICRCRRSWCGRSQAKCLTAILRLIRSVIDDHRTIDDDIPNTKG